MKKAVFSKKSTTNPDVVAKDQQTKPGPVSLDVADLKKVSGGLPRGGWSTNLPRGGWAKE